jgi:hypothetical protein
VAQCSFFGGEIQIGMYQLTGFISYYSSWSKYKLEFSMKCESGTDNTGFGLHHPVAIGSTAPFEVGQNPHQCRNISYYFDFGDFLLSLHLVSKVLIRCAIRCGVSGPSLGLPFGGTPLASLPLGIVM